MRNNETDFSPIDGAWVNRQNQVRDEIDARVEEIVRHGYTVIKNAYTEKEVEYCKKSILGIYQEQIVQQGGEDAIKEAGDLNIARQLLAYDDFFLGKATLPTVIKIVQRLMGEYFILYQQNGNLNKPNVENTTTPWHRDLTFWHVEFSRPIALSALHAISPFTDNNGAVMFLPGSHKSEEFPSSSYVESHQSRLIVDAGSVVLFDSMMFHRSGYNTSKHTRYSINHMYTLPLLTQQISLPRMLNGRFSEDPFLRWFLGYNSMQQPDIYSWRNEKVINARKVLAARD